MDSAPLWLYKGNKRGTIELLTYLLPPAGTTHKRYRPEAASIKQSHAPTHHIPNISHTNQPENAQKFFNSPKGCLHLSWTALNFDSIKTKAMSTQSKKKQRIQSVDKRDNKKFFGIVVAITLALLILLYLVYAGI